MTMDVHLRTEFHDINLASRKAEEAALRRYLAVAWLESLLGPPGIPSQPLEREFLSCLRNGLILCKAINIIQPGAVPKVVESNLQLNSINREFQPPPAFQYFENVRNFLVAVEELRLPAFEASDLGRDIVEAGPAAAKVTDCILALKAYHELKQMNGGNGYYRHAKSPIRSAHARSPIRSAHARSPIRSASKICPRPSPKPRTCLDMSAISDKQPPRGQEDALVKVLVEHMLDSKENINESLLATFRKENADSRKLVSNMVSSCLEEQLKTVPLEASDFCFAKVNVDHSHALQTQEKELLEIKALLSKAKKEFQELQAQFQRDFIKLGCQVEEMSTAAHGYQKVVEENKKLHNMVQDLKGNIRVFCRIRPAFQTDTNNVIDFIGKDGSLVVLDPSKSNKDGSKIFQFNQVFGPSSSQGDVFKETQPFIRSVMDGYNVCIFAYGQTGSGKTYTMSGPSGGTAKDLGINYLALAELFQISNQKKDFATFDISVQMVEIYNEQVRDLLTANPVPAKLDIRTCATEDGLILPDAVMYPVKSATDVANLMQLGEENRSVSSTAVNNQSSRSHSILTVHVLGEELSGGVFRSRLHLVDLAGSERVGKSEVSGDNLKEAQHINKSLSCLGDVISALSQKNSHIPYRNSKLTLLLQDSLGGNAKTLMFAHVSPEADSFGEAISTLKFAQRVSTIELGSARLNKETSEVIQLKEQIETLKKALAIKEAQSVVSSSKIRRPRSPSERTPPRSRRLSLENGEASGVLSISKAKELRSSTCAKPKARAERTPPPRSRRLSIENGEAHGPLSSKTKEAMTDRTPPRIRRLSIENGSSLKTDKPCNLLQEKRGPKSPSVVHTRARRLTLEGPKYSPSACDNGTTAPLPVSPQKYGNRTPDIEACTKQIADSDQKRRVMNLESRTKIQRLELPDNPEVIDRIELQNTESRARTTGKGSQIRKSLRSTIGKLISGSEKKNHPPAEAKSPPITRTPAAGTKNGRRSRRQSLAGMVQPPPPPMPERSSRRSSLGGKPIDLGAELGDGKTVVKRWL